GPTLRHHESILSADVLLSIEVLWLSYLHQMFFGALPELIESIGCLVHGVEQTLQIVHEVGRCLQPDMQTQQIAAVAIVLWQTGQIRVYWQNQTFVAPP